MSWLAGVSLVVRSVGSLYLLRVNSGLWLARTQRPQTYNCEELSFADTNNEIGSRHFHNPPPPPPPEFPDKNSAWLVFSLVMPRANSHVVLNF